MAASYCRTRLPFLWQKSKTNACGGTKRRFSLSSEKQQKKKNSAKTQNKDLNSEERLYRVISQKPAHGNSDNSGGGGRKVKSSQPSDVGYSGVPVSSRDETVLPFKQLLHQRYIEAKRSVVIRTQNPESTIQSLASFGNLKHAHYTSQDKGFILAQFGNDDSATKLRFSAGFFNEPNQFPMRSRVLFDTSYNQQKRRTLTPQISEANWQEKHSNIYPERTTIDQELMELCARRSLDDNDLRSRFFVCLQLEELLQSLLPDAHIIPYGSCLNGFGWFNSDLDMMLCFNKELYGTNVIRSPVQSGQASKFKILTELFSSSRHLAQRTLAMVATLLDLTPRMNNVFKILNARVPIIRFRNLAVDLNCDLSIQAMDSIKMTELLYLYSVCDQRVKPLMTAIKQWAINHNVTSSGDQQKTTTIGFLMMLVFYLQTRSPPVLPTLRKLQSLASTTEMFYIEDTVYGLPSNPASIPPSQNKESIESLLHGFFAFYSGFDFKNKAISVIEGATFDKPANSMPIHIENPLCIGLNICQNVASRQLGLLTSAMKEAAARLEEMATRPLSDLPNLPSLLSGQSQMSRLSVLFSSSIQVVEDSASVDISVLFADDPTQPNHENSEKHISDAGTSQKFDQNGAEFTESAVLNISELFADDSTPPHHKNSEKHISDAESSQQFDQNGAESSSVADSNLTPPRLIKAQDTSRNIESIEMQKSNKDFDSESFRSDIHNYNQTVSQVGKESSGKTAVKKTR